MPQEKSIDLSKQIKKGIAVLKKGGVIAFPTDTVYSLGASIYNESAVRKLYRIKERPFDKALPVLVADVAQMKQVATKLPTLAYRLAERFLPGALTLILPKSGKIHGVVTGGGDTVAVRIPDHPVPIALIKGLGGPIIGTSANKSGHKSGITASEVKDSLGDSVDLIIDGGKSPGGKESTIIDLTKDKPKIVREGAIPRSEIELICGLE